MKTFLGVFLFCFWAIGSAQTQPALQTVTAWQGGTMLPSSSGQVTSLSECNAIIAANLSAAPSLGYTVNSSQGTFTDPESNITIKQGCVDAEPFYEAAPKHPFSGPAPVATPIPWSIGVCTEVILTIGQSNGSNSGRGRYTAGPYTWGYGGNGVFYPASDPMPGTDGTDASPWPRLADLLMGRTHISSNCQAGINRVIIAARSVGGSCISQWAPGGSLNSYLVSSIQDMLSHGLVPTRILWHQGECDAGTIPWASYSATSSAYQIAISNMLSSIRQLGITAPIYVAIATICNLRTSDNPSPHDVLWRDPSFYVQKEIARLAIRNAQSAVVTGENIRAGANTDTIDWRMRAAGDGCHGDERFLFEHARRWTTALTGAQF